MNRGVAIFGATGLVGRTLLGLLEERAFPTPTLRLLASDRGDHRAARFRGREVEVEPVSDLAFADVDLALFAVPNALAEAWADRARERGARVIDNSSAFRYHADVPLVVPEINRALLESRPWLVANPNCSTIALVMALKPLLDRAKLERLIVSTYQSVSGAGAEALEDLESGVRAGLAGDPPARAGGLPPFAFNVVPHIDRFEDNAYSREEMKIAWETRKILGLPDLPVSATAVRVPVRVGHAASVHAEFDRALPPAEARAAWRSFPGLRVVDDPAAGRYPTPLEAAGGDPVLVGRARTSLASPRGLEFFVASDNLRKGAALNAVQIAETLTRVGASTP
ncbi:MAG: aspartate-semialdehyde dehydrogenase [Candidatus Eisenbacteria bacterium]|nr:aspartate-semialdehyde dehydrogenase [Candidatus Eisenbacteria bacterium]